MSQTIAEIGGGRTSVEFDAPVYFFDLVEDRPEIGGVAEVSRRLRESLAARFGRRFVAVRAIAASLGCGDAAESYLPRERRAIERLAARDPASTFLVPNFQSPIARIDHRARPRIVNIVHDVQFAHLPDLFTVEQRTWLTAAYAETRANADAVAFVSRATRDGFTALVGAPAKSVVIPAPLGTPSAEGSHCSPRQAPHLLAVQHGDHHPHKNIDGLLRLFAGLSARLTDLTLVVAGRGDSAFREACARLPRALRARIEHRGFVPRSELTALYRGAAAFVSLSRFEGFNMPAAEAASCGTPLILSDLPVHRELHAGAACFLDPSSPDLDVAARYLGNEAEGLRGYSWAHAAACSLEAVGLAHARLLTEVSAEPVRPSWRTSPTTRVFRVGTDRQCRPAPQSAEVSPGRPAIRRRRLARVFLAGTMLGGSATLGSMMGASPGMAATAPPPACGTAVNASGGAGGASSDGTTNGGERGSTTGLTGGSGMSSSAGYYGGGGGGAGGDCTTPTGGAGGGSNSTLGGASNANGGTAAAAGNNDLFSGGGGGGGGYYGGMITGTGPGNGFTGGAGQTGGAGGGELGNTGGGGGGGGGLGTALSSETVELHGPSQGGNAGAGGTAIDGAGGHGGDGGIGTAVFNGGFLIIASGISTTGGNGGAGGDIAPGGTGTVGTGGAGGIGLLFGAGGSVTNNNGTIAGGGGGSVGTVQQGQQAAAAAVLEPGNGLGGAGVVGANIRIVSSGVISGGLSGDGMVRANAITFTGGINTLSLENGFSLRGDIAVTGTLIFAQDTTAEVTNTNNVSQSVTGVQGTTTITGSGSLIKTGPGTLILSGPNTYSGGTTIQGGALQVGAVPGSLTSTSLGTGSVLLDGGTLQAAAQNGSNFGFSLGNAIAVGATGGSVDLNGNSLRLTGNITDGVAVPGALTFSNSAGGGQTLTLSGTNSFTGGVAITNGAFVQSGSTDALGTGTLQVGRGGYFFMGGHDQSVTILSGTGGILNIGDFAAPTTNVLSVQSGSFGGLLEDGTSSSGSRGVTALTKVSDGSTSGGTLILSGQSYYTGATTVMAGTLQAGSATGFADYSAYAVASGATLDLGGFGNSVRALSGTGLVTNSGAGPAPLAVGEIGDTSSRFDGTLANGTSLLGLSKAGAGTLILTGTNTYTGGTAIGGGTLQIGTGGTSGSIVGDTTDNATLAFDRSDTLTYGGAISGSGGLIQIGPGTLVLTGSNIYTGGTTISGGTLQIGAGGMAGSIVGDVSDMGTLAFARRDTLTYGGVISGNGGLNQIGPGTLVLTGSNTYTGGTTISGGTLQIGAGGTTGSIPGNVTDNATLAFARSDAVTYGGVISGSGGLNQVGPGSFVLTSSNTYTGGTTISGGTLQIGNGGITGSITGDVVDNAIFALARSDTVTDGGVISGSGQLSQVGPGTFVLTGSNTYTGGTTISGGALQIGNGGTAGAIVGDVLDNATLTFDHSDTVTFSGAISGNGGLNQIGPGTLNLTGADTYLGPTTVQAGRLAVNGSLGGTAVTVASGATLGGSGTIAGGVTIADGGILAPGNSPGTITVGSLTLTPGINGSTGSVLNYELGTIAPGSGQTSDLTNVTGNLVLAGTLNATDSGGFTYGSYRIFNYGGTLTNGGLAVGALPAGFTGVVQTIIPNQINLVVASPTTPLQFWDGALTTGNGTIAGGSGTWTNTLTNWTDPNGGNNAPWGRGIGIFAGTAGMVAVTDTIAFQGLQFTTDGYTLVSAGGGTLVPSAQAFVRVSPGETATIAAPLTGTGGLEKLSAGTLVLAGANIYAGGTTVSEGTLQIGNGGTTGSVVGNIVDNAALVFNRADPSTFGGVISGTGSVSQVGAGTLTLTGADTYTGATTIAPGTTLALAGAGSIAGSSSLVDSGTFDVSQSNGASLPSLEGNGAVELGSKTLTLTAASGTFGGAIGGAGRLVLQAGTEVLTGANSYTGGTAITGGTLQIGNGGTSGSIVGDVADFGSLAFDRSDAVTFNGAISGGGQVAQNGTGILTLGRPNSYGGGTAVNAGTLAVGSSAALGTGGLILANGTTLQAAANDLSIGNATSLVGIATVDTQAFSLAFSGPISGTGTLNKTGTGTLTLMGTGTYGGGTVVRAGTLDIGTALAIGSGPLALDAGTTLGFTADLTLGNAVRFTGVADPTIDTGTNTDTISGTISGPGALAKAGSGTLILTGTDPYTGATTVAAGTLEVDGSTAASATTVNAGATLSGTGTVGSIIARDGATVAPGTTASPYGVLRTPGSAAFFAGATYQVNISPTGQTSALAVNGTASLGGAAVTVASVAGTYNLASRYEILTATGGVQGRFGSLSTATALAFLNPTLSYSSNAVTLAFQSNGVSLTAIALTPNETSVAAAIQSLDPNSVIVRSLQGLSQAQARVALDQLSGAAHASVATIATQDSLRVSTQILDRLWNIGGGEIDARTLLQQLGTPGELPAFVNCYAPLPAPAPRTLPSTVTAWGEGFGDFGHDGGDRNGTGLDRSLGGFIIGYDAPLHGLGAPYRVGIAGGYTDTSFSGSGSGGAGSNGTFESVFGSLYGGARYGAIDVRGGVMAAGTSTTIDRTVAYPGVGEGEHSVYGGNTEQLFAELGYRFSGTRWVVEPVVNAAYTHVHLDDFHERGGAAALFGFAQDNDVGTTTLGARAEYAPFVGVPLVGRAFLGWRHGFGDIDPATKLAFESGSIPFTSQGAAIDRNALASELGVDWRYSGSTTLGVAYTGQIGPRDSDNGLKGRAEYKF